VRGGGEGQRDGEGMGEREKRSQADTGCTRADIRERDRKGPDVEEQRRGAREGVNRRTCSEQLDAHAALLPMKGGGLIPGGGGGGGGVTLAAGERGRQRRGQRQDPKGGSGEDRQEATRRPTTVDTASSASSFHLMWRTVWLLAQTLDDDPLQLHKCWFRMGCRGERRNGNRRWWRGGGGEVVCRVRSVRRPTSCDAGPNNKPQQSVTIDLTRLE